MKSPGQPAARPLLPDASRPLAVAIVVVCVLMTAVQAVWLRYGMETSWLVTAIDAKVQASLAGHPLLRAVLVWPGEPVPAIAMTAALVLACIPRRQYGKAAFVAISVPLAVAITELLLKPLIGRTSWGNPFPSGHVTSVAALATVLAVLLAGAPATVPRLLRLVLACTAFLIAAAVAVGVVGAHMHHFADSVGGAAVGTGTVLLTALILDLVSGRHSQPRGEASTRLRPLPPAAGQGSPIGVLLWGGMGMESWPPALRGRGGAQCGAVLQGRRGCEHRRSPRGSAAPGGSDRDPGQ